MDNIKSVSRQLRCYSVDWTDFRFVKKGHIDKQRNEISESP